MMTTDVEKIYMTWEQFDKDINNFTGWLKTNNFTDNAVILALKRGGFPTSTTLSNKTGTPISTVAFQTRDGDDTIPNFLEPDTHSIGARNKRNSNGGKKSNFLSHPKLKKPSKNLVI